MADTDVRPALTGRPRPPEEKHGNGLLFAGLLLAGVGVAVYETRKGGGSCGPLSGPAANLPTGLYITYFNSPACPTCVDQVGTTWWVVGGTGTRYGVPSQTQLQRCWPGATYPPQNADLVGGFGQADATDNEFIRTVGDVTACTACPPGSPGAAAGA